VPELGTIKAQHIPWVILTSNRTRELGDALRRRCLYLYVELPGLEKEVRVLHGKVPGLNDRLALAIARFMQGLRKRDLRKAPGIAESIDWAQALVRLHQDHLDAAVARATLGCLLKDEHDLRSTDEQVVDDLVAHATGGS